MANPSSAQFKAWIILSEVFGEEALKRVKPSSFDDRLLKNVADIQKAMLDAYRAENRISSLLGFYGVESLKGAGYATVTAVFTEHRDNSLAASTLPSQNPKYREWLDKPSMARGWALRNFLALATADQGSGFGNEMFPPGFDMEAANRKARSDSGSNSIVKKISQAISPF